MTDTSQKMETLQQLLRDTGSMVIGYSGGVDSTFLAKVATDVLGEKALSVSAISESYPKAEQEEAKEIAHELGLNYVAVQTSETDNPDYLKNAPNRCYFCKDELMAHLVQIQNERNIAAIAIGSVTDDLGDYRPGQNAAKNAGCRFPLIEAGMTKDDVRELSKEMNLKTWNKPAFACLASRFPYGEEITKEKLAMVEQAEDIIRSYGFQQFRVRHHNNLARIEILPDDFGKLLEVREIIYHRFKELGYAYIAMDLLGFRSGSMNETLVQIETPLSLHS